ncbi:SWI/SNF complex subunit SWI3C like [Actinidia chinensis var. chinensis]|uniref:SWI/SNF complex subunit SWI3C like n=1 Tax=Actinidia chinensis var. chinensis TaxID=1590841 RepID=A0A2R6Q156_ACTCC|nr:SWI/SNF complex subunit SWI3C like [Actinidia chinensis var. chinensis]
MPASSSETRTRWRKKRKREPQIARRSKPQYDDVEDDDDEEDDFEQAKPESDEDQPQNFLSGPDPARESEVLSDGGARVSDFPPVVKRAVNRPHSSVLAIVALERAIQCGEGKNLQGVVVLENISHGQLQALSAVPTDAPSLVHAADQEREGSSSAPYVITPPPIMEGRGVVKWFGSNRVHVVPMHADWFSPNSVHRLERQVVPHFFSGKSAEHPPERYMECRNRIVAKYMENPERRLSVGDCQGLVAGIDIDDLTRIVRFLDHWGIINYCAATPNCEARSDGSYLREDSTGEVHVPSAALKSIDSLIQFDKPRCRLKAADVYSSLSCHDGGESDLDSRIRERLSENRCNYCSRPLPTVYYQSQKEVDSLLCLNCFHDGRFVTGHSSIDFIRIDSTKDYGDLDGESWTDQETLLLLEAMEIYNENWNEIAEHVGTKSKAQCILHFVRLPMEDGPLENVEVPSLSLSSNLSNRDDCGRSHSSSNGDSAVFCLQGPDSENRLPFANSANPVMALVSFLASAVGPRVAAACAHASLAVLSEDSEKAGQMEASGHGNRMNLESTHNGEGSSHGENANSSQRKEDNSEVNGQWNRNGEVVPLPAEKVTSAAKAGLAAAATKAKLFADHEEREIQRLSANIINHQLKRLELKLKQFAEVETLLMKECEQVERARQRIATEWTRMMPTQIGPAGASSTTNLPGVGPSMVNNAANNRQPIITGSPSQPFIPGYGNNQQMHPQFMARQPMYGLGPRLPLSALHPSSSATPNVMFNAAANAQPALNHPMLKNASGASSGLG